MDKDQTFMWHVMNGLFQYITVASDPLQGQGQVNNYHRLCSEEGTATLQPIIAQITTCISLNLCWEATSRLSHTGGT